MARPWSQALLATLLALGTLVGCGAEPPTAPPSPLRILLVNADGWTAPGVTALRDALRGAGHTVVQVSSRDDRSGSGTAMTAPDAELTTDRPTGDRSLWTTTGTTADAALVGLKAVMGAAPPDLVIVGADPRVHLSLSALHSGTVGAALTAAGLGFPAVAVGVGLPDPDRPRPDEFAAPAAFVVRLVDALGRRPAGAPLMPPRTALNVNYPAGSPRGVVAAPTAMLPQSTVSFIRGERPGSLVAVTRPGPPTGNEDDDVRAFARGEVTLSDLVANPDRTAPPPRTAVRVAPTLVP